MASSDEPKRATMSRAAFLDAFLTPSFPSPRPNAIRNPRRILSRGRSNCTLADFSVSEAIARSTPIRTATLLSLSSSAVTFFTPVALVLNWPIRSDSSRDLSILGAPNDLASNFLVAAVRRGAPGAPVIFAILAVTLDVFLTFFFGSPVSIMTFFLTGFFFATAAGAAWTGKGDAAEDDFGASSSSPLPGAGNAEMNVLHSLTIFFCAASGYIPIADANEAAAAHAMELSSWLNSGSSGTAYIFDGGSRVSSMSTSTPPP
mmetsp:Transcript_17705/g.31990  ORF Transcript_17705/g.31990 Transcript_17705/m.31990 type:complete len:260 (-) Transcript_17705:113-892(-)